MQKRNGRSFGKVPVRHISGACATLALNPLLRVVVSALFSFVSSMGGARKRQVTTCCRPLFFSAPFFPPPPALCRYLLPRLRVVFVFVRETAVLFFVPYCPCNRSFLLRVILSVATGICSSSAHMLCSLQPLLSFPIFLHHILQNTCRLFCFGFFFLSFFFFSFIFLFFYSFFFSSSLLFFLSFLLFFSSFSCSGLFRCVLVPGTPVFHSPTLMDCDCLAYSVSQSMWPHN